VKEKRDGGELAILKVEAHTGFWQKSDARPGRAE
jgi:hypothetical protein